MNIDIKINKNKVKATINNKKIRWGRDLSYLITGLNFEGCPNGICELNQNPIAGDINFRGNTFNFMLPILNTNQSEQEFKESFMKRKDIADGIKNWLKEIQRIDLLKKKNKFSLLIFLKRKISHEIRFRLC